MTQEEFKQKLWAAAGKLRGSVAAAAYKYPVLGMVFLKYVSDLFDAQAQAIRDRISEPESPLYIADPEIRKESEAAFTGDKTFYDADNVFWVPKTAHFSALLAQAAAPDLAQRLDKAMGEIEAENPQLKGVLYREFSRLELEPGKLGELMQLLAPLKFDRATHSDRDVFGEVYEYFLGQFALKEGARAGEFYTPKSVVNLLVEILAPFKGTIYDPACGSGGMFVQSAKFKDAHQTQLKKKGDLAIHGQELMAATRRLALMNLAVHGLSGDLGESFGDTFANDQHKSLRADHPPESDEEFLPVIKIAQLHAGNTRGADKASAHLKPEYMVNDGDVLFSWSGSLEVEVWCGGQGALNQHLFKVTSSKAPKWYYYFATRQRLSHFRGIAANKATTMGHIQRRHLTEAKMAVPPSSVLAALSGFIEPMFDDCVNNGLRVRSLEGLRDTLLPRLISGKLRLPDTARLAEEVA